ncbi:FAD-binding oxidoreductase [Pseudorhodoferax sp.]|uniref:FAD-binding oxidoreductase n=1 Tax=Pseudorhodoferax sp. TaxID=1993553 RepID=UPI002DD64BDB|nr:FAD-binding protein [Pseudorhodoferax sp.]
MNPPPARAASTGPAPPPRRRALLATAWALLAGTAAWLRPARAAGPAYRVRPGDPGWPTHAQWESLRARVGDALVEVRSPWTGCQDANSVACKELFASLRNPYAISDHIGLTQSLGWVDAWTSQPSRQAVVARSAADVAAAVQFARTHRLRLVVKGGGHSYKGQSSAPDSLLVWTHALRAAQLHEAFVPEAAPAGQAPQRAVSLGAGALWAHAYDTVTTQGGGYVQGGGCLTVGVAGLVQSGGFGSFSKAFGLACASLLEAEVVTADGQVRIANAHRHADLFWGLKGGGGGTLGIVTRLTLRVHPLPETFGAVNFTVQASSSAAFRRLIALLMEFCARQLLNPHWGEQIRLRRDNSAVVSMVFQGLSRAEALAVWQPFLDAVDAVPDDWRIGFSPLKVLATSARDFWSPTLAMKLLGLMRSDDRPGAPATNVFWPGDQAQAGQVLHAYESAWLPAGLLQDARRPALVDALFEASRHWGVSLHLNKGLAGATPQVLAAARDTAMNPAVLDAFALAISGAEQPAAYPGIAGHEPDVALARTRRQALRRAMDALRRLVPDAGSYLAESDFFQADWQRAFWGPHYERLRAVKARYDPEGLFCVHHGVGSEDWSGDGFSRRR